MLSWDEFNREEALAPVPQPKPLTVEPPEPHSAESPEPARPVEPMASADGRQRNSMRRRAAATTMPCSRRSGI